MMLQCVLLAALASVSLAVEAGCRDFQGPCGEGREVSECPRYAVVKTTDDYQIRTYPAAWWTGDGDCSEDGEFMKLFRYITGSNAKKTKIDMTAPVLMSSKNTTCSHQSVMFYAPYKYQTPTRTLPKPTEDGVHLVTMPELTVAVRCYGGWFDFGRRSRNTAALSAAIQRDGLAAAGGALYAGYDSPMKIFGRHNEVWLPIKRAENEA